LNSLIDTFTPFHSQVAWLGSTTWTLLMVAIIQSWKGAGINMLVYIAALNAVPRELIEAARVEGAGTWRIIRKIKLPLIAPAFTFNITLTLIGALSTFDMIIATTTGGPAGSTETMNMFVWQQWATGAWGYATSISLVLFLMTSLAAFPLIAFLRRREVQL
jgi:raffinose/stachyose/melibiose transport system permease protein